MSVCSRQGTSISDSEEDISLPHIEMDGMDLDNPYEGKCVSVLDILTERLSFSMMSSVFLWCVIQTFAFMANFSYLRFKTRRGHWFFISHLTVTVA